MSVIIQTIEIICSDDIEVFLATRDNDEAADLSVDFLKKLFWSIRCVVHTSDLCSKDVFNLGMAWNY